MFKDFKNITFLAFIITFNEIFTYEQQVIYLKDSLVIKDTIIKQNKKRMFRQNFLEKMVMSQSEILNIDYEEKQSKLANEKFISSEEMGLAEIHLARLAKKAKSDREILGGVLLGLGAVTSGIGLVVANASKENFDKTVGYIVTGTGLFLGVSGGIALLIKHPAEKEYTKVCSMDTLTIKARRKREYIASIALENLSARAKNMRITNAVLSFAMALGMFVIRPYKETYIEYDKYGWPHLAYRDSPLNAYNALIFTANGVLSLMLESEEERAFKRYLKDKEILESKIKR